MPSSDGSVSAVRAANRMSSRRRSSAHSWRSGQPGPSTPYTAVPVKPACPISIARPSGVWKNAVVKNSGLAHRIRIAVLALSQVPGHNRREHRVIEPARVQPVQQ